MDKESFETKIIEYLSGEMSVEDIKDFETYLSTNPAKREQLESVEDAWRKFASIQVPEPNEEVRNRFYQMLSAEIAVNNQERQTMYQKVEVWIDHLFANKWRTQIAYSLVLLMGSFLAGYHLKPEGDNDFTHERYEIESLREQYVMALLDESSTTKRLQAVNESSKIDNASNVIIKALFETLNNDPNVNVRLAALESLEGFTNNPQVRTGLVDSIVGQESPLVQIALADLMVSLQEKDAIHHMRKLLKKEATDASVKQRIQESIIQII